MSYYKTCPYCGAHLDSGEFCDCTLSTYNRLTPENKRKVDAFALALVEKRRAVQGVWSTLDGKVEHVDHAVSTSHDTKN